MQCPIKFNNVCRIQDEKAADRRIFQEFNLQNDQNSDQNSADFASRILVHTVILEYFNIKV